VVELNTALGRVEDTTGVELEDELVSLDGDGNGASSDGSLDSKGNIGLDQSVASGLNGGDFVLVISAILIDSDVRVASFAHHTEVSGVVHGLIFITTIAAHAATISAAVDNLLLGERKEGALGDLVAGLLAAGSGESPA
jgi:hypothetical protein